MAVTVQTPLPEPELPERNPLTLCRGPMRNLLILGWGSLGAGGGSERLRRRFALTKWTNIATGPDKKVSGLT